MERRQQLEGNLDFRLLCVGQRGPGILIIGFERRVILRNHQLAANVAVHVRVGQVMHILGDGPLPGQKVTGQFVRRHTRQQLLQLAGQSVDGVDPLAALVGGIHEFRSSW